MERARRQCLSRLALFGFLRSDSLQVDNPYWGSGKGLPERFFCTKMFAFERLVPWTGNAELECQSCIELAANRSSFPRRGARKRSGVLV